jgi:hypothetical protein
MRLIGYPGVDMVVVTVKVTHHHKEPPRAQRGGNCGLLHRRCLHHLRRR